MSEDATPTQVAPLSAASTSQVRRRNLTSTAGVQRNMSIGGICRIAAIREICSTVAPDLLNRNGSAVQIKPMYIPSGRINTLNAQGAGHTRTTARSEPSCGRLLSR